MNTATRTLPITLTPSPHLPDTDLWGNGEISILRATGTIQRYGVLMQGPLGTHTREFDHATIAGAHATLVHLDNTSTADFVAHAGDNLRLVLDNGTGDYEFWTATIADDAPHGTPRITDLTFERLVQIDA